MASVEASFIVILTKHLHTRQAFGDRHQTPDSEGSWLSFEPPLLVSLIGIIPKLNVSSVLFTLFGYVQDLAIVNAHYLIVIAAC